VTDRIRTLMTTDDQLDDVKRARLWARLEARLPAEGAGRAVPSRWRLASVAAGALLAAAAALALFVGRSGESARALVAPADATLTAMVGPYTRVAVVGPARVEVGAQGERTTVRVRSGTMLAVFDGAAGRSLHVEAPGVEVEVVGTLFAIAVDGATTCVSVAHGRVRVTTAAGVVMVGGGERVCSGGSKPDAIEPRVREALVRHEQLIAIASPRDVQATEPTPQATPPAAVPATQATEPRTPQPAAAIAQASTPRTQPTAAIAPASTPQPAAAIAQVSTPRTPQLTAAIAQASEPRTQPTAALAQASEPRTRPTAAVGQAAREVPAPATPSPPPAHKTVVAPPAHASPSPQVPPAEAPPAQLTLDAPSPVLERTVVRPAPAEPPTAAPAPAPTPAAPPTVTADTLYAAAEAALAKGNLAVADRALARIVDEFSSSPLLDQALYERARLAYQRHAWSQARRDLDQLAAIKSSALGEPGQYLACRVALAAHDAEVAHCFAAYRATYPRSPHALDVLALLVDLAYADGGCRAAAPLIGELVRDHHEAASAHAWRGRCPERP
jgi:ferric-dicitrate binding protein FerR (iron transport regulator)